MGIRVNQGYVIVSSVHIGESEIVLGVNTNAPSQYVTWMCNNHSDYYWGHYFSDGFAAEKDLIARAQQEIRFIEQQRGGQSEKAKTVKDRGRER